MTYRITNKQQARLAAMRAAKSRNRLEGLRNSLPRVISPRSL